MINKQSYGFNTFTAVRIGEIQESTNVGDWYWIEGSKNIVDWITRGKNPNELNANSIWQTGPIFLQEPVENRPVYKSLWNGKLPEENETIKVASIGTLTEYSEFININNISNYRRLIQITARVCSVFLRNPEVSLRNLLNFPSLKSIQMAEVFWIQDAQKLMLEGIRKGDYKRLCPRQRYDGVFIVGGRVEQWFGDNYNTEGLILLPYKHTFSVIYAEYIHNKSHLGVAATVSKIRLRFWITKVERIVKSIRNK